MPIKKGVECSPKFENAFAEHLYNYCALQDNEFLEGLKYIEELYHQEVDVILDLENLFNESGFYWN